MRDIRHQVPVAGVPAAQQPASTSTPGRSSVPAWSSIIVSTFRVVAHTIGPVVAGGQLSQNHWSIYLLTLTGSIQLNMELADTTINSGELKVKEHGYVKSNSAVKFWDVGAAPNIKAGWIRQLIQNKGRDRYYMDENGVGCRWWV